MLSKESPQTGCKSEHAAIESGRLPDKGREVRIATPNVVVVIGHEYLPCRHEVARHGR